jgi:hypothetical protein
MGAQRQQINVVAAPIAAQNGSSLEQAELFVI